MDKKQYYLEHRKELIERAKRWNKEHYKKHPRARKPRSVYDQKYRDKNKGKVDKVRSRDYDKKYRDVHRERKRLSNHNYKSRRKGTGIITNQEWIELLEYYGNKCLCCGSTDDLQLDHVIPLSLGGMNIISNAQPLCRHCNSSKRAKVVDYRI